MSGEACLSSSPEGLSGLGRGSSGVSTTSRMATGWTTSTSLDPQRRALGSDLPKSAPALSPAPGFLLLVTPSLLSLQESPVAVPSVLNSLVSRKTLFSTLQMWTAPRRTQGVGVEGDGCLKKVKL